MTRRLLISYLSLAVVVLAMLEVPLGFINARGERARLTSKVERDAVTIASLAESTVEGEASTSNLPALKALGTRYAADTGARVVITNGKGDRTRRPGAAGAGPAQLRDATGVPGCAPGRLRDGHPPLETLGYDLLYVAVPIASGGDVHGAVRITLPDLRARPARAELLARARGDRRRRARGGGADRTALRPLDPAPARGSRAGGGRGRRRRPQRSRARAGRAARDPRARARVQRHGRARRGARLGAAGVRRRRLARAAHAAHGAAACGSRTSSATSATAAAAASTPRRPRWRASPASSTSCSRSPARTPERLRRRTVDLVAVAARAARRAGGRRAGAVRLELVATGRVPSRAGADRVAQVIDNLVSNALRHAPGSSVDRRHGLPAPGGWQSSAWPTRGRE